MQDEDLRKYIRKEIRTEMNLYWNYIEDYVSYLKKRTDLTTDEEKYILDKRYKTLFKRGEPDGNEKAEE